MNIYKIRLLKKHIDAILKRTYRHDILESLDVHAAWRGDRQLGSLAQFEGSVKEGLINPPHFQRHVRGHNLSQQYIYASSRKQQCQF